MTIRRRLTQPDRRPGEEAARRQGRKMVTGA
jgi:hypothetical protein